MTDLRLGVIGLGLRSSLATLAHRPSIGSSVTVACDRNEQLRLEASRRFPGAALAANLDDMLDKHRGDMDAVLILTPDHLHAEHAVRTLEAGLTTFLEKPMAITVEDADRILEAAYRTGTRLYVGHNMRHMPVITAIRKIITDGVIGEVKAVWCRHFVSAGGDFYFKDWHADRRNTTSLLLQKGAHDIDIIHWLAGGYTKRVGAVGALSVYGDIADRRDNSDRRMRDWYSLDNWPPSAQRDLNPVVDVEDISMANLELDNDVLASYQQCHFTPDYWRNYTVIGDGGRLENFGDGPGAVVKVWTRRTDRYSDEADQVVVIPAADEGGHGGADPCLIDEFVRFARDGAPATTSPLAARMSVAVGVAATQSLRSTGAAVEVPPMQPAVRAWLEEGQPIR